MTEGNGTAFGMAVNVGLHADALPTLMLSSTVPKDLASEREMTTYAAFGMTAEFVRKHARSWLASRAAGARRDAAEREERYAA